MYAVVSIFAFLLVSRGSSFVLCFKTIPVILPCIVVVLSTNKRWFNIIRTFQNLESPHLLKYSTVLKTRGTNGIGLVQCNRHRSAQTDLSSELCRARLVLTKFRESRFQLRLLLERTDSYFDSILKEPVSVSILIQDNLFGTNTNWKNWFLTWLQFQRVSFYLDYIWESRFGSDWNFEELVSIWTPNWESRSLLDSNLRVSVCFGRQILRFGSGPTASWDNQFWCRLQFKKVRFDYPAIFLIGHLLLNGVYRAVSWSSEPWQHFVITSKLWKVYITGRFIVQMCITGRFLLFCFFFHS